MNNNNQNNMMMDNNPNQILINNDINIQEPNIRNNNEINDDEFIGLTEKETIENEIREKNGKIKINPVGCGRELNWDEMEDCSNEVIAKLKEIAVDGYYSGLLKLSNKINEE